MIPTLPLAYGLRRDRDRALADERAATNAGDARRALSRSLEAAAIEVEIIEAESADGIRAALSLISMMERIGA